MSNTQPLMLATTEGLDVDFGSGFVLLRALDHIAAGGADKDPESLFRRLLLALAADARSDQPQHLAVQELKPFLAQLAGIKETLEDEVRARILAFPQVQRVYQRLAQLQGDPAWLFRLDGNLIDLVTLAQAAAHPPAVLKWDAQSKTAASESNPAFALEAKAGAQLTLDVLDMAEALARYGLAVPQGMVAVGVSASGALSGGLKLSSTAPVTGSASGSLNAGAELTYVYQFKGDKSVIGALRSMHENLPAPGNLRQLNAQLKLPAATGLRQARVEIEAGGSLAVELSLERATSWTSEFAGPAGAIVATQALAATASLQLAYGRSFERRLVVERVLDGDLSISSRVERSRSFDLAAGFGLGFQIDGLDDWAKAWLGRALPEVPARLKEIVEKFSNPGALLSEAIEANIDGESKQMLAKLLLGQASVDETTAVLTERFLRPVRRAFDSVENLFDAAADAPAEVLGRVVAAVQANSGDTLPTAQLQALIAQPVVDAWKRIIDGLRADVDRFWTQELQGRTTAAIAKLLAPLSDAIGASAAAAKSEQLAGQVQGYLKRYGEWRAKLFGEVERSLSGRIGFAVKYGRKDAIESWLSRAYQVDVSGLDDARWGRANATFRDLLAGRVAQQPDFGGAPTTAITELGASGSTTRTLTATLDLLPFQSVFTAQRKASAQLFASPSGEIRSAVGALDNQESTVSRDRAWTVRFAGAINLADARLREGLDALPMGVELTVALSRGSADELRTLLERFAVADRLGKVRLFEAGQLERLTKRVMPPGGKGKQAVRLSFGVMFATDALADFVSRLRHPASSERWADLLLDARRGLVACDIDGALDLSLGAMSKALKKKARPIDLFHAFANEPGDKLPQLKIDLIGSPSISVAGNSVPLKNSTDLIEGARQLKKAFNAWDGLRDFAKEIGNLPGVVVQASAAVRDAVGDAKRTAALESGVVALLDVQAKANTALGWTLDSSDYAFGGRGIAPDMAALLVFAAETLGAERIQGPSESLRAWRAAPKDRLSEVTWDELKAI